MKTKINAYFLNLISIQFVLEMKKCLIVKNSFCCISLLKMCLTYKLKFKLVCTKMKKKIFGKYKLFKNSTNLKL